jgi:hypothetical protein
MKRIDIDTLTGPSAPLEHCGELMRWDYSRVDFEGQYGSGFEVTLTDWVCKCGATLTVTVRVPS